MAQGSRERVRAAAHELGLEIEITTMVQTTRTALEAARACGCAVSQIVKSLVFERADDQSLVLLLIAGDRSADLEAAARTVGSALTRADPRKVRAVTGFAIGGVAPIGHRTAIAVFFDPALLVHQELWAAAGAPDAVFRVEPRQLVEAIAARPLEAGRA